MQSHPADPLVRFTGVQKTYDGEHLVVRDLNLSIGRGEFVTLLGPSGSGKTTCLMMLAGFEVPTQGDIYLGTQRLNTLPPYQRNIGMVFQNYALFPHMTVEENLLYPLKTRKMPKDQAKAKVERILDMIQLTKYAKRRPQQLSGGQQQRVALARALVFEPQLVLMDEPLGALDKQLREHMQMEIRHLHEQLGLTVVFVTHDQDEALTMSNRVAVFNDGVIQQIDSPQNLYEYPANAFVAQFIGENNTLPAKVISRDQTIYRLEFGQNQVSGAYNADTLATQEAVLFSIRPERVRIGKMAQTLPNQFSTVVQELVYLGDHVRLRCEFAGNTNFNIKVPVSELTTPIQPQDHIMMGWHDQDARALKQLPQ
ncbi:ABC transporter ATP-binding protein [Thiofilum flexile]|uniref:ABC transporter ATP-binding protein n=1 Tax=Thiofilum flexile TaxID=125627 RepID=UPI00035E4359|nr:ABC transporter ATP-binding protein [Thiofilum flexile]